MDPVDGTKNFAAGSPDFGVMLALLRGGEIAASWIFLPKRDLLFVAEAGGGATLNGSPLRRTPRGDHGWVGTFHLRHLPAHLVAEVPTWFRGLERHIDPVGCGAVEYTDIAIGRKDFATFYRLMPWDHLPGALLLRECGGAVRHLDGADYRAQSQDQMIVAVRDQALWRSLCSDVFVPDPG
jgi:fructose-1,6-bisphosphatase/inositol monophosphatase family enzyme